jgi:microcystin-dependent protein
MANEYILKSFDGGAQTTTLTSAFTVGNTTLSVANGTSFPDGSSGKFVVVVDRGLANEEKFLISTTSGASSTTFNITTLGAGYDGTSAVAHNAGATVDHCLDAYTIEQANRYVNLQDTKGSLVTHTGTTTAKIAASATNNLALLTDSTTANGIKWGQVPTAGIVDANITLAKLATAVQNLLVPAGVIVATLKSTADAGWIALNGTPVAGAQATYPSLYAATSGISGWWSGSTFTPPNMTNKMLEGVGTTAVGAEGGSNTTTIAAANLPAHFHDINHDHGSQDFSSSHSHTPSSPYEKFVVQDQLTGDQFGVSTSSQPGGLLAVNIDNTASATVTIAVNLSALGATSSTGTYTTTDRSVAVANTAMTTTNAHIAVYFQIKAH